MTDVATLLAQSRAAHLGKKQSAGRTDAIGTVTTYPDYSQTAEHLRLALSLRQQAHELDPTQADPAWAADRAANRGVSSEALCAYFTRYLQPEPTPEPKSIAEIDAAVTHADKRTSHAYALLLLESGWITAEDVPSDLLHSGAFQRFAVRGESAKTGEEMPSLHRGVSTPPVQSRAV